MSKVIDIEKRTLKNNKKGPVIIFTDGDGIGARIQIAVSSLKTGEDIDWETHKYVTQFVRVEAGEGLVQVLTPAGKVKSTKIKDGSSFTVSSFTPHRIVCTGGVLKFYSIYSKDSSAKKWVH